MEEVFSAEQLTRIKSHFTLYDINKDGSISGDELPLLMESLGLETSQRQIKSFMKSVDTDKSGSISLEEFVNMVAKKLKLEPIQKMFQQIDKDGDGYLTIDELRIGLQQLNENITDADLARFISTADTDTDGRVDYIEFAISMLFTK